MNLAEEIKKVSLDDVELIETLDYDHILFDLINRLQSVYDVGKESTKGKIIMDAAYVQIQVICQQADRLLENIRKESN